jgi:hypothetical protein
MSDLNNNGNNGNGNNDNDLSNSNNKFYLYFTQIGKIIVVDDKKYFQCESDGLRFPIKTKGNHRSQDTDIIDKTGCFSVIPICESNGKILSYHIVELDKNANSEAFTIQARVKQTIRNGGVQFLISIKGSSNITITVQTNNQFKMSNNRIYNCQGYRENDFIYASSYSLISETINHTNGEKLTVVEQSNINVDKYAEVVASNYDGVLIYIPANQIESMQWRLHDTKKYKLVTLPDGIKIINATPMNIDDTSKANTSKTCQHCIYEVNSICSQPDSPLFSSIVANDSTCIKCTI